MVKKPRFNLEFGETGEKQARKFLQKKGLKILASNFKTRWGEIDIIAQDKDQLVFIEVKTRTDDQLGFPEEAVTKRKIASIKKAAYIFTQKYPNLPESFRIDIISITRQENDVRPARGRARSASWRTSKGGRLLCFNSSPPTEGRGILEAQNKAPPPMEERGSARVFKAQNKLKFFWIKNISPDFS